MIKKDFNIPQRIFLYKNTKEPFDFQKLISFIRENFGNIKIILKNNLPGIKNVSRKELAFKLSCSRIKDINKEQAKFFPLPLEIENEIEYLNKNTAAPGLIYDGAKLQIIFERLLDKAEKELSDIRILITDRLLGTFEEGRFHLRTCILGASISIISLSGIVEAPAKPKEFYILKQKLLSLGLYDKENPFLKQRFKDQFIDYPDKRIIEIVKGLLSQAIFYHLTGEAFCKNKSCRLYNAHWQKELIYSQIKVGRFCSKHKKLLGKIRIQQKGKK